MSCRDRIALHIPWNRRHWNLHFFFLRDAVHDGGEPYASCFLGCRFLYWSCCDRGEPYAFKFLCFRFVNCASSPFPPSTLSLIPFPSSPASIPQLSPASIPQLPFLVVLCGELRFSAMVFPSWVSTLLSCIPHTASVTRLKYTCDEEPYAFITTCISKLRYLHHCTCMRYSSTSQPSTSWYLLDDCSSLLPCVLRQSCSIYLFVALREPTRRPPRLHHMAELTISAQLQNCQSALTCRIRN